MFMVASQLLLVAVNFRFQPPFFQSSHARMAALQRTCDVSAVSHPNRPNGPKHSGRP